MKCPPREHRFPGDDIDVRYMSKETLAKLICRHQTEGNEWMRKLCEQAYDNWAPVPDIIAALPDDHPVRQWFEEWSGNGDTCRKAVRFEMEDMGQGRFKVTFFDASGLGFVKVEWRPERPYPPAPPFVRTRAITVRDDD
jgi:hypothetical protein